MFSRWGAFVYRFRRPIVIVTIVLARARDGLRRDGVAGASSGGWLDPSSESARVSDRLASEFSAGRSNLIALFRTSTVPDATSPASPDVSSRKRWSASRGIRCRRRIVGFRGDRRPPVHLHERRRAIRPDPPHADRRAVRRRADDAPDKDRPTGRTTVQLTGYGPVTKDSAVQSEKDLARAPKPSPSRWSRSS